MRNILNLAVLLTLAVSSATAMASDRFEGQARVISSTPQTERVNNPSQDCHTEYQRQVESNRDDTSIAGTLLGGVAGGLLGSTIGKGNGRVAAAAIGAGVGAVVGDRMGNSRNNTSTVRSVPVESCRQMDNWQTVTTGYNVTYSYDGKVFSAFMNEDPGSYIDVDVSVTPKARQRQSNYNHSERMNGYNNGGGYDPEENYGRSRSREYDRRN